MPPLPQPSEKQLAGLKNAVVWLSGASSGIGRALALKLASLGCKLVLGDINDAALKALADEIDKNGGDCVWQHCDVTSWGEQLALFELAVKTFGRVDVVLPNAGVSLMEDFTPEDDDGKPLPPSLRTVSINLSSVLYSTSLAFHFLPREPSPSALRPSPPSSSKAIVFTGSASSLFGTSDIEYSAAKAGVLGVLNSVRMRCRAEGIRLGMVAPYFVRTALLPEGFEPDVGFAKLNTVILAFLLALTTPPSAPSHGAVLAIPGVRGNTGPNDTGGPGEIVVMGEKALWPEGWVRAADARRKERKEAKL